MKNHPNWLTLVFFIYFSEVWLNHQPERCYDKLWKKHVPTGSPAVQALQPRRLSSCSDMDVRHGSQERPEPRVLWMTHCLNLNANGWNGCFAGSRSWHSERFQTFQFYHGYPIGLPAGAPRAPHNGVPSTIDSVWMIQGSPILTQAFLGWLSLGG